MSKELKKRIVTSFFLLSLLVLMFFFTYILIVSLIVISVIAWIEFYAIISKVFSKVNNKNKILRFVYKFISLFYMVLIIYIILMAKINDEKLSLFVFYSILVSIMSDLGGLIVGKIFKGKKLTKISPQKTISGSIGSFIFSLSLVPFFINSIIINSFYELFIITLLLSLTSQLGDIFISLLKRKAKVKDTSDLLPGHGGVLDRIDGMIFAIPVSFIIFNYF
jgi:phosphatidate cytidylyltransferase